MFNASDLLGGLLQGGGPRGHATGRLEHAMRDPSFGGASGGLGQILGGLGGASGGAGQQGGGGLLGSLAGMLGGGGRGNTGGMGQGMAMGGLGALAASVLGGGRRSAGSGLGGMGGLGGGNMRGAVGAGGLAVLGMLAMKALRNSGAAQQAPATTPAGRGPDLSGVEPGSGADAAVSPPEQTTSDHAASLVLRAMIDAAKADGHVDATERQRLLAKAQEGGADPEAASFLERELDRPADPDALAADARDPVLAAQVYAASLLAIQVDTPAEQAYLRSLAGKLGLEPAVVAQLHGALGAPPAA